VRQPAGTSKGQIYRDTGAAEWILEIDATDGWALWTRLEAVHRSRRRARERVRRIMRYVEERQRRMVAAVRAA
jgi:hypothetical protein